MKVSLYKAEEFRIDRSVKDAKSRLQSAEQLDPRKWCCEVQGDRFEIMPAMSALSYSRRVFWPEVYGRLTAEGHGTAVHLAFRPMTEACAAWFFAILGVLGLIVFSATSEWLFAIVMSVAWGAIVLLVCCLSVRRGKKAAVEAVKEILEA